MFHLPRTKGQEIIFGAIAFALLLIAGSTLLSNGAGPALPPTPSPFPPSPFTTTISPSTDSSTVKLHHFIPPIHPTATYYPPFYYAPPTITTPYSTSPTPTTSFYPPLTGIPSPSPIPITGTIYYVSRNGNNSGGRSWATAWTGFTQINWSVIQPGDAIYFDGETSSTTYTETLILNASGVAGNPIVLARADTPNHNGTVIIDGQSSRSSGIWINGNNYVLIRGFTVRNHTGDGQIQVDNATGVIVENNDLFVTGHGGLHIDNCTNCVFSNNRITTPNFLAKQTDGIYAQNGNNNIYEYNRVIISNDEINGHDDGIQLVDEASATIRYNYFEQNNSKTLNSQGVWIHQGNFKSSGLGTANVHHNIVYAPNTENRLIALQNFNGADGKIRIEHNTLVGGRWGLATAHSTQNPVIKNNLLFNNNASISGWLIWIADVSAYNKSDIDYNILYAVNPFSMQAGFLNSSLLAWSSWRAQGLDLHGSNLEPQLANITGRNFRPLPGSPACAAASDGTTIGALEC